MKRFLRNFLIFNIKKITTEISPFSLIWPQDREAFPGPYLKKLDSFPSHFLCQRTDAMSE